MIRFIGFKIINKLYLLVVCVLSAQLAFALPIAEVEFPSTPVTSEIKNGISVAIPVNLICTGDREKLNKLPLYAKGREESQESCDKNIGTHAPLIGFKAVTNDYGQLKYILEANKGSEIDSLIVVGPMNKDDFRAIWNCAVYGNMQVLNLENAIMENNAIPDYAMYDPIQFESSFWLKIRRIILPEGLVSIGKCAFSYMGVEEINIPSTAREIGPNAFSYDKWLNCELIIPEGVKEIKYQTFNECYRLSIAPRLPESLIKVGEHAFSGTRFDNLVLPSYLEEIGQGAFVNSGLSHINFPEACLIIGNMAFQGCSNLKEITFPSNLESISGGLFSNCYGLEKLTIHDKCQNIEDYAFMGCINLREVSFNPGLKTIEKNAFAACAMTKIHLPSSLQLLGEGSLAMSSLKEVWCAAVEPPVCKHITENMSDGPFFRQGEDEVFTLYVPYGSKDVYSSTWGWNIFNKIEETNDFPWAGLGEKTISESINCKNVYDLQGNRVSQLQPGHIYIFNGKRMIYTGYESLSK